MYRRKEEEKSAKSRKKKEMKKPHRKISSANTYGFFLKTVLHKHM